MSRSDIKKMNYPMVDAMARAMDEAGKQLEAGIGEVNKVASLLEDGGLRGEAGTGFTEVIRSSLVPSMQRLQEKFEELKTDLHVARNEMKKADQAAAKAHKS